MVTSRPITLRHYYSAFKSLSGLLAGTIAATPYISKLLPASAYLFPPLGEVDSIARGALLALAFAVTFGVYFWGANLARAERAMALVLIVSFVSFGLYLGLHLRLVRRVDIPSLGTALYVSVGYERTAFANATFGSASDWELLRARGADEEQLAMLWTPRSLIIARVGLYAAYSVSILGLVALFSFGVLHDLSRPRRRAENQTYDPEEATAPDRGAAGPSSKQDLPKAGELPGSSYLAVIQQAVGAVPEVKWALGVAGVISVVGLVIVSLKIHPVVAILGFIIMIAFMGILLIFAYSVRNIASTGTRIAKVFVWFVLLLFIVSTITLFAAVTFDRPWRLRSWIDGQIKPTTPGSAAAPTTMVIDFAAEDTSRPPFWVQADDYLSQFGITVSDVTGGSKLVLLGDFTVSGSAFVSNTSHKALTQVDCHGEPVGFTLQFDKAVSRVSIRRAALISGSSNGISHPAWTACAFRGKHKLGCKGEHMLREFSSVSEHEVVMDGPEITSVRLYSDCQLNGKAFTAFCAVLIESITLTR